MLPKTQRFVLTECTHIPGLYIPCGGFKRFGCLWAPDDTLLNSFSRLSAERESLLAGPCSRREVVFIADRHLVYTNARIYRGWVRNADWQTTNLTRVFFFTLNLHLTTCTREWRNVSPSRTWRHSVYVRHELYLAAPLNPSWPQTAPGI